MKAPPAKESRKEAVARLIAADKAASIPMAIANAKAGKELAADK